MKKIIFIMTLALMLASCDPGYTEDVVIRNASSHYVTITDYGIDNNDYDIADYMHNILHLAPNEEVVIEQLGGIGCASLEEGVNYFKAFYGDSVKLGFGGFEEEILVREKTYYACSRLCHNRCYQCHSQ